MVRTIPLQPGKYYHIYNRGNNREDLFIEERNYVYFLKLYSKHILPVAETFAYCLLKNHFHILIKIRDFEDPKGFQNPSGLNYVQPHQAFSNLFNAYAKAINKTYDRSGSLFEHPFKRNEVISNTHLLHFVAYIHKNPQKHEFVDDFRDWPYSSYASLLSSQPDLLNCDEVFGWFDGVEGFEEFHRIDVGDKNFISLGIKTLD